MTDKKIENFPVGISIDTSAIYQIPNGKYFSSPCYLPIFISIFSGNCTHGPELYANKLYTLKCKNFLYNYNFILPVDRLSDAEKR